MLLMTVKRSQITEKGNFLVYATSESKIGAKCDAKEAFDDEAAISRAKIQSQVHKAGATKRQR